MWLGDSLIQRWSLNPLKPGLALWLALPVECSRSNVQTQSLDFRRPCSFCLCALGPLLHGHCVMKKACWKTPWRGRLAAWLFPLCLVPSSPFMSEPRWDEQKNHPVNSQSHKKKIHSHCFEPSFWVDFYVAIDKWNRYNQGLECTQMVGQWGDK